jgi:hypothetical protein
VGRKTRDLADDAADEIRDAGDDLKPWSVTLERGAASDAA